jgi:biotin carboxyl carrier protein
MAKKEEKSDGDKKAEKKIRNRTLVIEGTGYKTLLTNKFKTREKWIAADENKVTSIIPGTVITVLVRKGQQVEEGDSLLILESMKMQNKIACPRDGKIKAIKVSAGQNIPKGYVMVELE